jgi:hypothetical protein
MSATFTLSTIVFSGRVDIPGVSATTKPGVSLTNTWHKLIFFFNVGALKNQPVASRGGLRRTRIAGGRGDGCELDIVALIPQHQGDYVGVTNLTNPTFWFYLPPSSHNVASLQFRLLQKSQEIWIAALPAESKKLESGLLKILYQGAPLANDTYEWQFSYQQVGCQMQTLAGHIQKEALTNSVVARTTQDRLQSYAQRGIWHELLTELIALRQQNPQDNQLAIAFRSLIFESPDIKYSQPSDPSKDDLELMEKIVNAPVIHCCQFTPIEQ